MEDYEFENRNVKTNSSSLAFSNYQDSSGKNEINAFHKQKPSTTKWLSIETLMKEI